MITSTSPMQLVKQPLKLFDIINETKTFTENDKVQDMLKSKLYIWNDKPLKKQGTKMMQNYSEEWPGCLGIH